MKLVWKFDSLFYHIFFATCICNFERASSSSSFNCDYYSVSNTASATQNYAICSFALCSGATVTISGSGCSCSGDQYLRLYDSSGNNVANDDDTCGSGCSRIVYTTSGSCQTYEIREGCYSSYSCSGTVVVVSSTSFYTSPSSAIVTGCYYAYTPNYPRCSGYVSCGYTCVGNNCAYAGSSCKCSCSACATYYQNLVFSPSTGTCVTDPTTTPITTPTTRPTVRPTTTRPTIAPSIGSLTCSPFSFDGATNPSYDATITYSDCYFILPPPTSPYIYNPITLTTGCGCSGDTYLRLLDPSGNDILDNDNTCGVCSSIVFTPSVSTYSTGVFTIRAGCAAKVSCSGQVTINGFNIGYSNPPSVEPSFTPSVSPSMIPSRLPTYKPTKLPSFIPTMKPTKLPTMKPSFTPTAQPTKLPTFKPSFSPTLGVLIAPQYSASNTNDATINYKTFCFSACGDQTIVADTGCSCVGSPVLKLYQRFPLILLATSAVSCNTCSQLSYYINRLNSVCNDFCIYEGCVGNSDCAANVTVSGVVVPSVYPTSHPSLKPSHTPTPLPSIKPSLQPSFQSSFQPSKLPTVIPSTEPTFETTTSPTRPTYEPSLPPTYEPTYSSVPLVLNKTNVFLMGWMYSTLAGTPVTGTTKLCQSSFMKLPNGWEIAPDNSVVRNLIGSFSWSTDAVYVASGVAIRTSLLSSPGTVYISPSFTQNGNTYKCQYCNFQIFMRTSVSFIPTISLPMSSLPSHIPTPSFLSTQSVSPTPTATIAKQLSIPTLIPSKSRNNVTTQSSPTIQNKTDTIDAGIVAGVTIGVLVVVLLISSLLYYYRKKCQGRQIYIAPIPEPIIPIPIVTVQPSAPPMEEPLEDFSKFILEIKDNENNKIIEIKLSAIKYFTKNFFNKIGEGKFGKVYKMDNIPCRYNNNSNPPVNKSFAVKQFIDDVNGGNIVPGIVSLNRETLYKEIKILSQFEHPNIIKLIRYSLRNDVLSCLIYEYGERGDLLKCLRDDATALEMTCLVRIRIAIGIIIGLSYLHNHKPKQPALHRDIKSSNIVIMKDFTAKIIDCGLAKYNSSDDDVKVFNRKSVGSTANHTRVGTPGYTCPRYMQYHNNYNISSEIYSVGIVFLELLSGLIQHSQINNTSESVILESIEEEDFLFDIRIPLSSNKTENNLLHLSRLCVEYNLGRRPKSTRDILRILRQIEKDFMATNNYIFENLEKEIAEQKKLIEENNRINQEREEIEQASIKECHICFVMFGKDARVDCCNNHVFCKGCFSDMVLVQVSHDKRGDFRNYKSKIICAFCFSLFPDVDVAKGSIEAFAAYQKACYEEIEYSVEAKYNKMIEDLKKAVSTANNTRMENINRHRLFIAENILTIKCPHCKIPSIIDFDHCLALTCVSCNCKFCGWCFEICNNDAHRHVRNCPQNAENGNLFTTPDKYNQAQGEKRKIEIIKYINENLNNEQDKRDLKELMKRDLIDLNIVL